MNHVLIDDTLLFLTARGREPADLRSEGQEGWTTGLWYHRLCRAIAAPTVGGALSRIIAMPGAPGIGGPASQSISTLQDDVGLISLRVLSWPMADLLRSGTRLNLLSLEALAAAEHLGAEICLAERDRNRPLLDAARARGVPVRFVTVPS